MRNRGIAFIAEGFLVGALSVALLLAGCDNREPGVGGSGTVEATEITVAARAQGEILTVEVSEGDRVEAGTLLARIEREDLELQLRQAEQREAFARARLDGVLRGAQEEDLRHAAAQLEEARQTFELAKKSYGRLRGIYDSGGATPSELDRAETELERGRAAVSAAEAQLDKLQNLPRPEDVRVARAQLDEASAGTERLRRRLRDTDVVAPRDGTVTIRVREAGEYVVPGAPLFTIADLSTVYLMIYIPEPFLGELAVGQEARVSVDGVPQRTFQGHVARIAEEAEFTPKNVQTEDARAQLVYGVEIRIDNRDGVFKIGMPAEARILTEEE